MGMGRATQAIEILNARPLLSAAVTDACLVVRERGGQALAYIYFEDQLWRRSAAKLPTKYQARRITLNFEIARAVGATSKRTANQKPPPPEA
jgi:hypothetical protein